MDRYKIINKLGRGGMADVYLAQDVELDRSVALKILKPEFSTQTSAVSRMIREARIVASLNHPNILRLHDTGEKDGQPFLVTEYLEGSTLQEVIAERPPSPDEAVKLLETAARAVHFAHQKGVLHRDLKPANIMLEKSGRVVVMDFGLAQLASSSAYLTRTGAVLGTPHYMSPEQVMGKVRSLTSRSDVYALGAVLYEMLSGNPPHAGLSVAVVYQKILHEECEPLRKVNPALPEALDLICRKAMAKEPRDRYASAEDFADDLMRYMNGVAVMAQPVRVRKSRGGIFMVAGIGIAVIAVSGILWAAKSRTQKAVEQTKATLVDQMMGTSEMCLRAALDLRQTGDLQGMNRYAGQVETICRKVIEDLPELAEPHYHWGRMLRAQLKYDEARKQQVQALTKDPSHKKARYERGLLTIREYEDQIEKLGERWNRSQAEQAGGLPGKTVAKTPTPAELEDDHARHLKRKAGADFDGLDHPLARAFQAYVSGQRASAILLFEEAQKVFPELEEPYELLAKLAGLDGRYDEAEAWLSQGIKADRGYIPFWTGRGKAKFDRSVKLYWTGKDPSPTLLSGIDDWQAALKLDPTNAHLWRMVAQSYSNIGISRQDQEKPDVETLEKGVRAFQESLRIDPTAVAGWEGSGNCHNNLARSLLSTGRDPSAAWLAAIDDFSEAIKRDPGYAEAWDGRGASRSNLAHYYTMVNKPHGDLFDLALPDADEAIRLNPRSDRLWVSRSTIRMNIAMYKMKMGGDGMADLQKCIDDSTEAIRLKPEHGLNWQMRANSASGMLHFMSLKPEKDLDLMNRLYESAQNDYAKTLQLNPNQPDSWRRRGIVHLVMKNYRKALADFTQAVKLAPSMEPALRGKMNACRSQIAE